MIGIYYPLVICCTLRHRKWPPKTWWIFPVRYVNVYQRVDIIIYKSTAHPPHWETTDFCGRCPKAHGLKERPIWFNVLNQFWDFDIKSWTDKADAIGPESKQKGNKHSEQLKESLSWLPGSGQELRSRSCNSSYMLVIPASPCVWCFWPWPRQMSSLRHQYPNP